MDVFKVDINMTVIRTIEEDFPDWVCLVLKISIVQGFR